MRQCDSRPNRWRVHFSAEACIGGKAPFALLVLRDEPASHEQSKDGGDGGEQDSELERYGYERRQREVGFSADVHRPVDDARPRLKAEPEGCPIGRRTRSLA